MKVLLVCLDIVRMSTAHTVSNLQNLLKSVAPFIDLINEVALNHKLKIGKMV